MYFFHPRVNWTRVCTGLIMYPMRCSTEYLPDDYPPDHRSAPCSLALLSSATVWWPPRQSPISSTRHLQTGDELVAHYAAAGSMSSDRSSSRLYWPWGPFWRSTKTVGVSETRWLSRAHRIRFIRISSNISKVCLSRPFCFKYKPHLCLSFIFSCKLDLFLCLI